MSNDWLGNMSRSVPQEELLLDDFYTIGIEFKTSSKTYTYKVDKSIELFEEDFVVVPTANGPEVVEVVRIDDEPEIDFNVSYSYKYIICKVDFTKYYQLQERSKKLKKTLEEASRRQLKRSLLSEFKDSLTEEGRTLLEEHCNIKLEDNNGSE